MRLPSWLGSFVLLSVLASACGGEIAAVGDAGPVQPPGRDATPTEDAPMPVEASPRPDAPAPLATCADACNHFAAAGCAEADCVTNCEQVEVDCAGSGYISTFQALLECAVSAEPIDCVDGSPQSTACASLTAQVQADCTAEAPDAGDYGCSTTTSNVACMQCCEQEHPEGVSAYLNLLTPCECVEPGGCAGPCASEYCASSLTYPQPNDACDTCVGPSLGIGGNCWYAIFTGCGQDQGCLAMESCMSTWCSNK